MNNEVLVKDVILFAMILIILLYLLCPNTWKRNTHKKELDIKEGFYEFLIPTSLNIPAMFALSDKSMSEIFNEDSHIKTPREGICK